MKFIEVTYQENIRQLTEDFVNVLLVDLKKSAPQINFTPELCVAIINKCVDHMNAVQWICLKKKRAEIKVVRLELEFLESGVPKFTFVPLDDSHLPVLIPEECPLLLVNPSPEEIREVMGDKEIEKFRIPETPPEDDLPGIERFDT